MADSALKAALRRSSCWPRDEDAASARGRRRRWPSCEAGAQRVPLLARNHCPHHDCCRHVCGRHWSERVHRSRRTRHRLPVPHGADPLSSVITHGPHHTRGSHTKTDNMSAAPLLPAWLLLHCSRGENEKGAARGRAQGPPHEAFRRGPARAAESGRQRGRNVTDVTTARPADRLVRMF